MCYNNSKEGVKTVKRKILVVITIFSALIVAGGFFVVNRAIKADTPQPSDTPDWGREFKADFISHDFRFKDDTHSELSDSATTPSEKIEIHYTSKQSVSFWDFFDIKDYQEAPDSTDNQKDYFDALAKKSSYSMFRVPGLQTFYLIIDETNKKTKGIFTTADRTEKRCLDPQDSSFTKEVVCPWKYYEAYDYFGGSGAKDLAYNGKIIRVAQIGSATSTVPRDDLQWKYIHSVNENYAEYSIGTGTTAGTGGPQLGAAQYKEYYWPDGGTFDGTLHDNGNNPPTITIGPSANGPRKTAFTFTLKYVLRTRGTGEVEGNQFYFVATQPNHPNLAVRLGISVGTVAKCENTGDIFIIPDDWKSWGNVTVEDTRVSVPARDLHEIITRKVYNDDTYDPAKNTAYPNKADFSGPQNSGNPSDWCPNARYIADGPGGWLLDKWKVQVAKSNESNDTSACAKDCPGWTDPFGAAFCNIKCAIYDAVGEFINLMIKWLDKAAGISFIETARAAPLSEQLRSQQVVTGWKFSLAVTDIIVIFALLLIAFMNILKLNIDLYAVKKSLPGLIVGVILANLSLLICRVIVDFASLLARYFITLAGGEDIGSKLTALMGIKGALAAGGGVTLFGIATTLGVVGGACLGILIVLIFLGIPGLLLAALAFLLYVRIYVIWILVILAPLAFVILGFPPFAQYFKTWWSWFAKWVFLAPVAYFFIALASKLGGVALAPAQEATSLSWLGGWLLGVIVLSMTIYVPFTMGGAIMRAWGNLGKMLGRAGLGYVNTGIAAGTTALSKTGFGKRIGVRPWSPKTAAVAFQEFKKEREAELYAGMQGEAYKRLMRRFGRGYMPWKWGKGPEVPGGELEMRNEQLKRAKDILSMDVDIGIRKKWARRAIEGGDRWTAEQLLLTMPSTGDWDEDLIEAYRKKFGGEFLKQGLENIGDGQEMRDPDDLHAASFEMTLRRIANMSRRPEKKYGRLTVDVDENGVTHAKKRTEDEYMKLLFLQMAQLAGRGRANMSQEEFEEMQLPEPEDMPKEHLAELQGLYNAALQKHGIAFSSEVHTLKPGTPMPFILDREEIPEHLKKYVPTLDQKGIYAFMTDEVARAQGIGEHVRQLDLRTLLTLYKRGEIHQLVDEKRFRKLIDESWDEGKGLNFNAAENLDKTDEFQLRTKGRPGRERGKVSEWIVPEIPEQGHLKQLIGSPSEAYRYAVQHPIEVVAGISQIKTALGELRERIAFRQELDELHEKFRKNIQDYISANPGRIRLTCQNLIDIQNDLITKERLTPEEYKPMKIDDPRIAKAIARLNERLGQVEQLTDNLDSIEQKASGRVGEELLEWARSEAAKLGEQGQGKQRRQRGGP